MRIAKRIVALTLLGVAVGAVASLGAIAFIDAVGWLDGALLVSPRARVQHEQRPVLIALLTVLVPAVGGLIVGLILRYLVAERRALGPPDTILAVQSPQPPPSARSGLAATLAAVVSLGAGASVGQYGPMVYLGTVVGSIAARARIAVRHLRAISIGCGVAAAISTAFNAPIAGLVFAHEVILRHYSMQAFAPATRFASSMRSARTCCGGAMAHNRPACCAMARSRWRRASTGAISMRRWSRAHRSR